MPNHLAIYESGGTAEPGDVVECCDGHLGCPVNGKQYTVADVAAQYVYLLGYEDDGWSAWRFRLISRSK